MNCEIKILIKHGIDIITYNSVESTLALNAGVKLSSNELLLKLPSTLQSQINTIASGYSKGACSKSAAYVGSVASYISKKNPNIIHDYSYFCPILNRKEDGFIWIN